jgi:hypothetical protein
MRGKCRIDSGSVYTIGASMARAGQGGGEVCGERAARMALLAHRARARARVVGAGDEGALFLCLYSGSKNCPKVCVFWKYWYCVKD